ncbi:MAG: hypothetical protein WKG00_15235 [Polyangiaceae bacterium]
MSPRPGVAKVRSPPLLARRRVELCTPLDGRMRELIEAADVVSEGEEREEQNGRVYYGTTSVLLSSRGLADEDLEELAQVLRLDPHTRLRVLRTAAREASSRASARLGAVKAEVSVHATREGVLFTVDVAARVSQSGGRRSRAR